MISNIHQPDEHAMFPHKIITCKGQKLHKDAKGRTIGKEDVFTTYLVCATCGHWSNRLLITACNCRSSCHDEMAERLAYRARYDMLNTAQTTEAKEARSVNTSKPKARRQHRRQGQAGP